MPENFKDYFSHDSQNYLKYRPQYPIQLFDYLNSLTQHHNLAYDFGCGNGQASITLAKYYQEVIGIDGSSNQIANAISHPQVKYKIALAHNSGLKSKSSDLITVVNALHWFQIDLFFTEVKRLLKDNGVIAIWCYNLFTVNAEIDHIFELFFNLLEPYWPTERELVNQKYQTITFPFNELVTPKFVIAENWTLDQIIGYIKTWSAYNNYVQKHNTCPLSNIITKLNDAWGNKSNIVNFAINLRVGRN